MELKIFLLNDANAYFLLIIILINTLNLKIRVLIRIILNLK